MSDNKRSIDPTIIAAVIGVMGTLCVTLVTLFANRLFPEPQPTPFPTWTFTATATITETPVPTDTVPAGEPTSTPAPDTPTPEPTLTSIPPAIGSDWVNGCISVLWRPYPGTVQPAANNGCLAQPLLFPEQVNLFFTENGSLKFSVNRAYQNAQVFGLFAPIPANGVVSVDTLLRRAQEGEIWMGVFAEPDIASQGLLAVLPAANNPRNRDLIQRQMPEQNELHRLEDFSDDPSQHPPRYTIVFELGNGAVRLRPIGEAEFTPVPVGSVQPWLFIGYQVEAGNNRIDGEFLNLLVQPQ